MGDKIICPACGHGNADGMKFCGECGGTLPQAPPASISLDKERYDEDGEILVSIKGISQKMIENNAFIAIYRANSDHNAYMDYKYPPPADSTMNFVTPENGEYEMRLYSADGNYSDETFVTSVPFTVGKKSAGSSVCASCGFANPAGLKFCGECGTKLETPPSGKCTACGQENPPGMKFCGECGNKLA
jgi:predicted amidophosphoribosyltransferase